MAILELKLLIHVALVQFDPAKELVEIVQEEPLAPIYVRARAGSAEETAAERYADDEPATAAE